MFSLKFYLSLLFSGFVLFGSAEVTIPDGEYFTSHSTIKKMQILNRKNGTIKVTALTYSLQEEVGIFELVDPKIKAFEGNVFNRSFRVIREDDDILLYEFDVDVRYLISTHVISMNKKELKAKMKERGIKSANAVEMEEMIKKKMSVKSKEKESEVDRSFLTLNPTSAFHQEHAGEIVLFSEKPILGQEDPTKIVNKAKVGDDLWGVAYLPCSFEYSNRMKKLSNEFIDGFGNTSYWFCLSMDIDDDELLEEEKQVFNSSPFIKMTEDDLKKNYVIFHFLPDSYTSYKENGGSDFMLERISERVGEYKNDLRLALNFGYDRDWEDKVFRGYFELDLSEGKELYADIVEKQEKESLDAVKVPTPAFSDLSLEANMMQQVRMFGQYKDFFKTIELVRPIIVMDWQVIHDDFGLIKGLYCEADILYRSQNGCGYMNFGFLREYDPKTRTYSDFAQQHGIGGKVALSCDKIKD